ncbi:MAG: redoxin domain-containing protein [Gemmatimonadales bacterium]
MSRQWTAVLLLVAGLAVGVYALIRFSPDTPPLGVGSEAPDVEVVNLATGDTISLLEEYEGSVTLVNIWATWCVPCRVEMPAMQAAYDSLRDEGFRIAAVSIDEGSAEKVLAFTNELGLTFDILQDPDRSIERIYQTAGVPESFLLNKDGVIIKRIIGAQDWSSDVNQTLIRRLLASDS